MGSKLSFISRPYSLSECKSVYGLVDPASPVETVDADGINSVVDAVGQGQVVANTTFQVCAYMIVTIPAGGGLYIIGASASFAGNSARDFELRDGANVLAAFDESDVYLKSNGKYCFFGMRVVALSEGSHTLALYGKLDTGTEPFYIPCIGLARCL